VARSLIGSAVLAWVLFAAEPTWFINDWTAEINWLFKALAKERRQAAITDRGRVSDQASCEARGGKWGPLGGLSNRTGCNFPYSDAGMTCSDSSECQGECLVEDDLASRLERKSVKEFRPGLPATGVCAPWEITFGCFEYVRRGKVVPGPCID
jgi:hypothetical protein